MKITHNIDVRYETCVELQVFPDYSVALDFKDGSMLMLDTKTVKEIIERVLEERNNSDQ